MTPELQTRCQAILDYRSMVKLTLLMGLCAGIMATPILIIVGTGFPLLNVAVGTPIAGSGIGLLMGMLGYPLYGWLSSKTNGQRLSGAFRIQND